MASFMHVDAIDGSTVIRPVMLYMNEGPLSGAVGKVLHPGQWEIVIS